MDLLRLIMFQKQPKVWQVTPVEACCHGIFSRRTIHYKISHLLPPPIYLQHCQHANNIPRPLNPSLPSPYPMVRILPFIIIQNSNQISSQLTSVTAGQQ